MALTEGACSTSRAWVSRALPGGVGVWACGVRAYVYMYGHGSQLSLRHLLAVATHRRTCTDRETREGDLVQLQCLPGGQLRVEFLLGHLL